MGLKEFIWGIMVKKGLASIIKVTISFLTSVKVVGILQGFGVSVDPTLLEGGLTAAFTSGLVMLTNLLKVKFGVNIP